MRERKVRNEGRTKRRKEERREWNAASTAGPAVDSPRLPLPEY
jgi:hypothetical protein